MVLKIGFIMFHLLFFRGQTKMSNKKTFGCFESVSKQSIKSNMRNPNDR